MEKIYISYFKTKIGELILGTFENKLCLLDFRYRKLREKVDKRIKENLNSEFLQIEKDNEILKKTKKQILEYLNGERKEFEIPILMCGTDFQKSVWKNLLKIKYGKTKSYLELSKMINNEKAYRAVANANGANSIALIIPCHRIIKNNNDLGGYGGRLALKKK
jgi:methylated-DNA-[protein]-cysteine S-methyltransferase